MKIFFGFLIASLILGAHFWRSPQKIKTAMLMVMIAGVCAIYFFSNQI